MNTSRKIAVFLGGQSSEHEVSINSGLNILSALDKERYDTIVVKIEKDGMWRMSEYLTEWPKPYTGEWLESVFLESKKFEPGQGIELLRQKEIAVAVILAMHGQFGEDGRLQAMLEMSGIAYTGSGVLASALAMDKVRSGELFLFHGLQVPASLSFAKRDKSNDAASIIGIVKDELGFPCILKPSEAGSSVATFVVNSEEGLEDKIRAAFEVAETIIFQEYIKGDEVTCGVLESADDIQALPPTQIIPRTGDFFDYNAKYTVAATEEVTPARLPAETIEEVQESALLAHDILGCRGLSRTDMIIRDGEVYVLETNTLPGMTQTSLLPQGAQAAGISFPALIDTIITDSLKTE